MVILLLIIIRIYTLKKCVLIRVMSTWEEWSIVALQNTVGHAYVISLRLEGVHGL